MVKGKQNDGEFWADKLMDLANLSAVVLIFGQTGNAQVPVDVVISGIVLYVLFVVLAMSIRKRR